MAENKKRKKQKKRNKPYAPLSKADRVIYILLKALAFLIIIGYIYGYEVLSHFLIFKNSDVLAFNQIWTLLLSLPFMLTLMFVVFDTSRKKVHIFGNKDIDYTAYRSVLPLFDKRYQHIEKYKINQKIFLKKSAIWSIVLVLLFCIGLLGCVGRQEFTKNRITTYSIFNTPVKEYSYNEIESYMVSVSGSYIQTFNKHSEYIPSNLYLTMNLTDGKDITVRYDSCRDIFAMKEIENQISDKEKLVNADKLEEFIDEYNFSDEELKVVYKLLEE